MLTGMEILRRCFKVDLARGVDDARPVIVRPRPEVRVERPVALLQLLDDDRSLGVLFLLGSRAGIEDDPFGRQLVETLQQLLALALGLCPLLIVAVVVLPSDGLDVGVLPGVLAAVLLLQVLFGDEVLQV